MVRSLDCTKSIYCVVTGASRGIGRTIAVELARRATNKINFLLLARSEQGLLQTKSLIEAVNSQANVTILALDLSKATAAQFEQVIDNTFDSSESAIIFHNAGSIGIIQKAAALGDSEAWQNYYNLNLFSVTVLNSVFLKKMQNAAGVGSISVVNITSLLGRKTFKYFAMYGSGKAARDLYFKVLAVEEPNIVVLNYSPGMVETEMAKELVTTLKNFNDNDILPADNSEPTKLTSEQTVTKMFSHLLNPKFQSGDIVDYYD